MHGTNWHLYILYSPLSLNRDSGNVKYERYSTLGIIGILIHETASKCKVFELKNAKNL